MEASTPSPERIPQSSGDGGTATPGTITIDLATAAIAVVCLLGEHDMASQTILRDALEEASGGGRHVVVDLAGCTFADDAVLDALTDAERSARPLQRRVVLVLPDDEGPLRQLARMIGLDGAMDIYESRPVALAMLREDGGWASGLDLSPAALRALRRGGPSSSLDAAAWAELAGLLVDGRPITQRTRSGDGTYTCTLNAHGRRLRDALGGA
jgi:anti-anti-sigma regulatory factor